MIKIKCTKLEKQLIRDVIEVQLDSLESILTEECQVDLLLFCIGQDITKSRLLKYTKKNIKKFMRVKRNPNKLFFLDLDNLSIFRHILTNIPLPSNYEVARARLWRKIFQHDKLLTFYNPN